MVTPVPDEPYDAGDPVKVKKGRQSAKFKRDTELFDLRAILKNKGGRDFFWRMLAQCKLYAPVESEIDEGKRRVGLWLLGEILAADSRGYLQMQAEHVSDDDKTTTELTA